MSPVITRNAKAVESELRALHSDNLTLYQIARALKLSPATVRRYMNHLKIGTCKRRKDRDSTPDHRVEEMVEMRKKGFTLDSIGAKFNLTRERVRQILQKECPDIILSRRAKTQGCAHCGLDYIAAGTGSRFCSHKCKGAAKTMFNRDTALDVMRERDNGMTWGEIAEILGNGADHHVFRARIQRFKGFFSASEQEKYFPKKGESLFKPANSSDLGQSSECEEDQESLIMRMLRRLFFLHRD